MALDRIRWKGEQSFRTMAYYFSVRWNVEAAEDYIRHTLGDFAVPRDPVEYPEIWAPGIPPQYSIVKRRSGGSRYYLLYGDGIMKNANQLGDVLARLVLHVNAQTVRQTSAFLLIHAGAVSTPAGAGILLPARAGGGKTTLVTALVRTGFLFLSDEAGAVDPVSRMLYPFQRPILLKRGHAEIFPDLYGRGNGSAGGGMWHVRPEDIRYGAQGGPCSIRFVVPHQYRRGTPTQVTPLTHAEGAMALLGNALNLPRYGSRALALAADVVRQARSYRLVSGDLDEAVRAITELTGLAE